MITMATAMGPSRWTPDPGEVEEAQTHEGHAARDHRPLTEVADQVGRDGGEDPHGDGEGHGAHPGTEGAVAVHELQVLGQHEEAAEQGEEDEGDGPDEAVNAR